MKLVSLLYFSFSFCIITLSLATQNRKDVPSISPYTPSIHSQKDSTDKNYCTTKSDPKECTDVKETEIIQSEERERRGKECTWHYTLDSRTVQYSLIEFYNKEYDLTLPNPRGAHITFKLCGHVQCNGGKPTSCIHVPGVKPTSAGKTVHIEPLVQGISTSGIQLTLDDGLLCEVTNKPRRTIIKLPCDSSNDISLSEFVPSKAYEGDKKQICHYYVEFPPSIYGCPLLPSNRGTIMNNIVIEAISGCMNSSPLKTTTNCHYYGGHTLSIMGYGLAYVCPHDTTTTTNTQGENNRFHVSSSQLSDCNRLYSDTYRVLIGDYQCMNPYFVSLFIINCTLSRGKGEELDVKLLKCEDEESCDVVAMLPSGLSYRKVINFKDKFSQFVEYGVGGLKKEIEELYRRAFASRDASPELVAQLGISHIRGILLYGPPGAGKTLLARTVAHMLGSKQVQLINGPEVISKYLGESERNLRQYFDEAKEAYKAHGDDSELYVIIIDEIDAICKPRGKSDQSSAGIAYDSLVNQLLTLLDGLNEMNNVLVIGMTNRKELMDTALLRPGRFEVQIEVGLPDEEGREEIFEIHTRSMRESGIISTDVSFKELVSNTTRFSGAEIAGIVRAATSYALERQTSTSVPEKSMLVTKDDFKRALMSITPAYTHSESHIVSKYLPQVYHTLSSEHESVVHSLLSLINSYTISNRHKTALIYGAKGSGKTTVAARVAVLGHFSYVKIITASSLIGLTDFGKVDFIRSVFQDAYKSDKSLIILDDIHRLVEYVKVGESVSVSHYLLHVLSTVLTSSYEQGSSNVLIIGTLTNNKPFSTLHQLDNLNFPSLFTWSYYLPLMNTTSIETFLKASHIDRLHDGDFSIPNQLLLSVSQLLTAIECACISQRTETCFHHITLSQNNLLQCLMDTKHQSSSSTESSLPLMKD